MADASLSRPISLPVKSSIMADASLSRPISLPVKKRRSTSTDREDSAAKVEHTNRTRTAEYLQELLEKRDIRGRRIISPLTEKRVRELLTLYNGSTIPSPGKEAIAYARDELEKRLLADRKYADAMEKLEEMQKQSFFLQYGDYYAAVLGSIRTIARGFSAKLSRDVSKSAPVGDTDNSDLRTLVQDIKSARVIFQSKPWATIYAILEDEDKSIKIWEREGLETASSSKPQTPMTHFLEAVTARTLDWNLDQVKVSIRAYVNRNSIVHADLQSLAANGDYFDLATRLAADLKGLKKAPTACQEFLLATQTSIMRTADRYFSEFVWDDENDKLKTFTPRRLEEISELLARFRSKSEELPDSSDKSSAHAGRRKKRDKRDKRQKGESITEFEWADDSLGWLHVIPKAKTLSTIMNQHFPEALAISYIDHRIVVELKEINDEQHKTRLDSLPRAILNTEVALRYNNGPIHGQQVERSGSTYNSK
jgi:hypothetical protein